MHRSLVAMFSLLAMVACGFAQPTAPKVFEASELGFRYSPPQDLRDLTLFDRQQIQKRAEDLQTTNIYTLLLSLRSGPKDTVPEWHSVGIESYPRERVKTANDREACIQFSRAIAGKATMVGEAEDATISGIHFVRLKFEYHQGNVTRYGRVFTAVMKDQLVTFVFTANDSAIVEKEAETMKTLEREKAQ